ncbi:MAG TPA: helix-turn-helix transcriptional regulator [Kiritimatiellia bacterium]|nr:helix-turn-helix transcriptional regulator [Kiritimatiellia bacterium]HMP33496.1 helix-turn-helix transcriptional regulator [Kiritimatiellia bacterium]
MGQKFRAAREKKKLNISKAAALTRIKVQHLEMMENDDFSKMPAPTYAKGFIRIYASFLGLDPIPLVEEYVERHLNPADDHRPAPKPARRATPATPPPPPAFELEEPEDDVTDVPEPAPRRARERKPWSPPWKNWRPGPAIARAMQRIAPLIPKLLLAAALVLVVVGISRCTASMSSRPEPTPSSAMEMDRSAILKEPPVRHLDLPAPEETTP